MKRIIVVDRETYKHLKEEDIPFEEMTTCTQLKKIVESIIEQEIYEYSAPSEMSGKLKDMVEKACKVRVKSEKEDFFR